MLSKICRLLSAGEHIVKIRRSDVPAGLPSQPPGSGPSSGAGGFTPWAGGGGRGQSIQTLPLSDREAAGGWVRAVGSCGLCWAGKPFWDPAVWHGTACPLRRGARPEPGPPSRARRGGPSASPAGAARWAPAAPSSLPVRPRQAGGLPGQAAGAL